MCVSVLGQAFPVTLSHLKLKNCANLELWEQRKRGENLCLAWEDIPEDFLGEVIFELCLEEQ